MTIPDYQSLMLPVLREARQGEKRVPETAEKIADSLGLSSDERNELLPSGKQRILHNRVHWAKLYLSKAGLIESPKHGVFTITAEGERVLQSNPSFIDNKFLSNFEAFALFINNSTTQQNNMASNSIQIDKSEATPEEIVDEAKRLLDAALASELLERILEKDFEFFEQLIVDVLVAMGYGGTHDRAAMRLGKSGDHGVDGVIDEDRLGLDRIYVQAKRYENTTVGRPDVQAFVGSLVGHGATKGVFVTSSTFSAGASAYAEQIPQRVILIDGKRLTQLMIENGVGVRVSRAIELKRIDDDFFPD
jgi:restriction system protein